MSADREVPLYVDLDGSVVRTDTLWESFASALRRDPVRTFAALFALASGRAALKRRLAQLGAPDVESLPLRESLVAWLREQRSMGRRIVLATAADRTLAESVADRVGVFDQVLASDGRHNLKGRHKLAAARRAIVVGAPQRVLRDAQRQAEVAQVFEPKATRAQRLRAWVGALRPHQWLKNLLVLLPLLASFRIDDALLVRDAFLAFVSFSLAASSGYLLNDLLDLSADRRHPRKRERAFAAGRLSVRSGFAGSAALLVAALAIAWVVGERFVAAVLLYLAMTAIYSGLAKRIALFDVAMLAGLYTVRVLAGGAATAIEVSFWLLAFSVFLFFSLALLKRCGELVAQIEREEDTAKGRGYGVSDLSVLQSLGIATSCAALVVLALYVQDPDVTRRYASPQILWLMLFGLLVWLGRLWLDTARGRMHDDPLVYALRDRGSRWLLGVLLVLFGIAAVVHVPR